MVKEKCYYFTIHEVLLPCILPLAGIGLWRSAKSFIQLLGLFLPSTTPPALGGMSAENEAGAKSALDPHVAASITPFVAPDHTDLDLTVVSRK